MPRIPATDTRVEYLPEFGRAVRIAEYDRPMRSDDEETAQTVSYMDELAAADADSGAVIAAAAAALDAAGIDAAAPALCKAEAVYWWLQRTVRYVATPGTSPLVDQTLISPCAVLAMPEPIGDCPQFSMLAAAIFKVLCIESRYVTIAAEPKFPDQWSHIYNTVEVFPGRWLPFDSSNGPEPGAEYARPFKRRVWPRLSPRCITKDRKEGLPDMMRTSYATRGPSMRNRALRGALGDVQCDQDGNCYDSGTLVDQTGPAPDLIAPGTYAGGYNDPYAPGGSSSSSSSSGPAWWQTLLNDAATIGTPLLAQATRQQPYFVTSPSGQSVLYNPNTGAVSGGATSLASAVNPTYLVIGVAAIAALAFLGKK